MPTTPPIKVPILGVDLYSKEFKQMTKRAQKMGRAVEGVGRKLTGFVTAPILALGAVSVKTARDFNESMANVGTLIPGQTKQLEDMKQGVMDLAVAVGSKELTGVSTGLYDTISAFGEAADPMGKLAILAKSAKAGVSTVSDALGLASAVTKGYGDTSNEAVQHASDLAFMTVKLGQTTFPDLAASIGKVVPLATTLNVGQEELFGSMATLTGVTGSAAEVSTQLASAMGAIIKPSSDMTKAAKKLGYESGVAMIKEIGLQESIKKLGAITGGSEEKLGKLFTRKEGLNAVLTLLGPQADTFSEKIRAMGNVAGATELAFKQQTEGINKDGHAWEQSKRRVDKALVSLGDKLLPVITKLTDRFLPYIDRIAQMSDSSLEFGIKAAGLAAALGPVLLITGKLIKLYPIAARLTSIWTAKMVASKTATLASTVATTRFNKVTLASNQSLKGVIATNSAAAMSQRRLATAVKTTNITFGQSIKQAGRLNAVLSVLAAGAFGWEIGTLIYDNLVKPLQDAVSLGKKARQAADQLSGGKSSQYTTGALEQKADTIRKGIAAEKAALADLNMGAMARGGTAVESTAELDRLVASLKSVETQIGMGKQAGAARTGGFEDISAGQSVFGGGAVAEQRFDEALLAGIVEQSKSGGESKIKIEFENLPSGVTPRVTQQSGAKVEAKGAIMAGAI